jgi:hypothetical protein
MSLQEGKTMKLTDAQMRAMELNLEMMDRLEGLKLNRPGMPMDVIVREFFELGRNGEFEMLILNKIGALLTPQSTEDLNLEIRI